MMIIFINRLFLPSFLCLLITPVYGFTVGSFSVRSKLQSTSTSVELSLLRKNIEVPLLDTLNKDKSDKKDKNDDDVIIFPLPSDYLPDPISTPFLYGMQLDLPIHKMILQDATDRASNNLGENTFNSPPMYGHLVWKNEQSSSLVGAIGCTAQILINAPTTEVFTEQIVMDLDLDLGKQSAASPDGTPPNTVLCRGGFRFVVKEIVKSIPYPIAIIDEIQDDADVDDSDMFASVSDFGDGFLDDDDIAKLSTPELVQQVMRKVQAVINNKLDKVAENKPMTPLEQSILEDSGVTIDPKFIEQLQAEEMAAAWDVFQTALIDDIDPRLRKFAIAFMAAELADFKNPVRQEMLVTRDSKERLQIVLRELKEVVGMEQARKFASQITDKVDDSSRDLKVGAPTLPAWAKTIVKGTRVEYFWNEEYGWVAGEVIENPVTILDEILLTILFDDGETHKLPLSADDKVRWRPA